MSRDWTKSFFRKEIFTPGSPEAVSAAPDEVKFLWKVLGLKKGSRVLDIPCGTGRHAVRLARRGASVLGVDITESYLREARRAAGQLRNVRFVRGDMRRIPLENEFDAAINLWTSFGYFSDPADDARTLLSVARALKPGGLFLIDMADITAIRRRLHSRSWSRRADGAYVLEDAVYVGGFDPKVVNEWTVLKGGRAPKRSRFVVRAYDRARLFAALRKAGLRPVRTWSGLSEDYGSSGPAGARLTVLSRKPLAGGAASR
ncbi:MAG: methyltransferase domain-containing protein [Elusimicrobia bacterium]|nr:methyltransferase domain-containing protein [Elusimicrobiota bacterium]